MSADNFKSSALLPVVVFGTGLFSGLDLEFFTFLEETFLVVAEEIWLPPG